jgi:chemotaxis protein CheX
MNELDPRPAAAKKIDLLDAAVSEVFDLMLGKTCSPVRSGVEFAASLTVTISLSGQIDGTCWLCLSQSAAKKAMEAMLGGDIEDNSMVEDAAKELCNVIVGSWKSKLPPPQASATLSLPVASYTENLMGSESRLYSFEGNLLALALAIRKGEQNYLTTD